MASIDKRPDGRYRARWREYPGGPQKTRRFHRKGDADRFLDAVRGDIAHGVYIDPAGGKTLFREYAEEWRAGQVHRPSTVTQCERRTSGSTPTRLSGAARSARFVVARSRRGSRS